LTRVLRPLLEASAPSRMIMVASGGMYTEPLDVDTLESVPDSYDGTAAYARCKRAQVALAEGWTRHLRGTGVTVNTMHPGWADTPGLRTALPGFSRIVGPLLRTPEEGADTIAWLAAAPAPSAQSGLFFFDRRARAKHRLRRTRRPDEGLEAVRLWRLCTERTAPYCTGVGLGTIAAVEVGATAQHPFTLTRDAAEEVFRTLATESAADRARNPGLPLAEVHQVLGVSCAVVAVLRAGKLRLAGSIMPITRVPSRTVKRAVISRKFGPSRPSSPSKVRL